MIENGGENENGGETGIGGEEKRVHHRRRMDHHMNCSFRSEIRLPLCLDSRNDL